MSSLKTNVVLNLLNTVTSIVFPIVTFPYAARVLLPGGIGAVNFQLSIINYIVLFVSLGIPMYGCPRGGPPPGRLASCATAWRWSCCCSALGLCLPRLSRGLGLVGMGTPRSMPRPCCFIF